MIFGLENLRMRKKAVTWFGYLRMRKNHCGLAFQICACAKK